jgi:hypothetical protein
MSPKYPNITVQLSGRDSNAFMILGLCQRAATDAGLPKDEVDAFYKEATRADHEHLVQSAMRWFNCE